MDQPFALIIDGNPVEYDGFYDDFETGITSGQNEITPASGDVITFEINKRLYTVGVWRENPDGSRWGIKGYFRNGEFTGEADSMAFSVSDRIA